MFFFNDTIVACIHINLVWMQLYLTFISIVYMVYSNLKKKVKLRRYRYIVQFKKRGGGGKGGYWRAVIGKVNFFGSVIGIGTCMQSYCINLPRVLNQPILAQSIPVYIFQHTYMGFSFAYDIHRFIWLYVPTIGTVPA